ncbi:rhodanese-like domain-containing protein [Streptomyces sp. NPDC003233]
MRLFGRGQGGPARVTAREAAARTDSARAAGNSGASVLLHVREADEWQAGHAPGAVHLPLTALAAGARLPAAAQARPVVVICRSGRRWARGVEAVDVIGGMQEWAGAGLPVVDARGGNGTVA